MRIKIINHVPTDPSPVIGEEYEVVKIVKRSHREGGNVYFVMCNGVEVGVLSREMKIIEE